jgi:hypothetical protein
VPQKNESPGMYSTTGAVVGSIASLGSISSSDGLVAGLELGLPLDGLESGLLSDGLEAGLGSGLPSDGLEAGLESGLPLDGEVFAAHVV